jgi:hypothetical protein
MVGPESTKFAADRSKLPDIFQMLEYRESADPAYPELKSSNYADVLSSLGVKGKKLRIGIGGWLLTNPIQLEGLKACFPQASIERADDIMVELRSVKSENELACLREGFRITEIATREVIKAIRPGMTELQLVGIAQKSIYENGAEYEGLPMYVFSEKSTRHAISRSTYREMAGDLAAQPLGKIDGTAHRHAGEHGTAGRKRELVEFARGPRDSAGARGRDVVAPAPMSAAGAVPTTCCLHAGCSPVKPVDGGTSNTSCEYDLPGHPVSGEEIGIR